MPKPDSAWMACLDCTRGSKGDKSCAAGSNARSRGLGCFNGTKREKGKQK